MAMILTRRPRRRVFLARGALLLVFLGLLANGPRVCPCPFCDWDGHAGIMRVSGRPSHVLCARCNGKGWVTVIERLSLLAGGRIVEPPFVTISAFEELPPGWPSFWDELTSKLKESKGTIQIYWPSPPTLTISTSGVLSVAQFGVFLAIGLFSPLWLCSGCRPRSGRRFPSRECTRCRGRGTTSPYRRWVSEPWRSRLRRARISLVIGILLSGTLYLAAQIPYRPCPRCPAVWEENRQAGDVIRSCPRCGDVGKIGLWNTLFLGDD
jgi:hypothetical protein